VPPSSIRALAVLATAGYLTGAVAASRAAEPAGPLPSGRPSVTGIAAVGKELTARSGTWAGAGSIAHSFRWYRCDVAGAHCRSLRGATASTYHPTERDVGKTIGLAVSASDANGSRVAYASLVGPIAASAAVLEATGQPQVAGAAIVGQPISVSTGTWSPTPSGLTYSWQRCNENGRLCTPIAGANRDSYTPAQEDVGHALLAVVAAVYGTTTQTALSTATTAATMPEVVGPQNLLAPSVRGIAAQRARLRSSPGVWTGAGTVSYAYQWYRCDPAGARCVTIVGATGPAYLLVASDVGRTIGLTVRAGDATGTSRALASLVGPIAPAASMEATEQPAITGDARVGATIGVTNGAWSPAPTSTSYAWRRCNRNGRVCIPIPDATGPTYTPTAADAGRRLAAVVTAAGPGGSWTAISSASAPIA
jgi:hypothetical protein